MSGESNQETPVSLRPNQCALLLHLAETGLRTSDRSLFVAGGALLETVHQKMKQEMEP